MATEVYKRLEESKQRRIFEAASEEFSAQGFNNASMNTLSKSAGISKGSIFQYFQSKDKLFEFVIKSAVAKVKNYLKKIVEQSSDSDFFSLLDALLKSGFEFIYNHPHLARIYYRVIFSGDAPSGQKIARSLNKRARNFISSLIKEGIKKGDLQDDIDIERTSFLIDSLFASILRAYYSEHIAPGLNLYRAKEDDLAYWRKVSIDLIKNGIQRR